MAFEGRVHRFMENARASAAKMHLLFRVGLTALVALPSVFGSTDLDVKPRQQAVIEATAGSNPSPDGHPDALAPATQEGALRVELSPVTARWRLDGASWQRSGANVAGIRAGQHQLRYSAAPGFTPPAAESITIAPGNALVVSRTYAAAPFEILIGLEPSTAKFRLNGGAWIEGNHASVPAGTYLVEYSPDSDFDAPPPEIVSGEAGDSTGFTRRYVRTGNTRPAAPGSLKVVLSRADGRWNMDGGPWLSSGHTVNGLPAGSHTVRYSAPPGWSPPPADSLNLAIGDAVVIARDFKSANAASSKNKPASLRVNFSCPTIRWSLDSGEWQPAGATVGDLASGTHTLKFSEAPQWAPPREESITLAGGEVLVVNRDYSLAPIQIVVRTDPSSASYRLNGGPWVASGKSSSVPAGNYLLEYSSVQGLDRPEAELVSGEPGRSMEITRRYLPATTRLRRAQPASLAVTLSRSDAQWRVDSGSWYRSGTRVSGLAPNTHTLTYSEYPGWKAPAAEQVTLVSGDVTDVAREYTRVPAQGQLPNTNQASTPRDTSPMPSLRVVLDPDMEPTTGRWRLDGGAWQTSGAQLTGLKPGPHQLDYDELGSDFLPLPAEVVTLPASGPVELKRAYTLKPSSFQVELWPYTAQWRINDGAWYPTNYRWTFTGQRSFTVQYSDVQNHTAPLLESVIVNPGEDVVLTREYVPRPEIAPTPPGDFHTKGAKVQKAPARPAPTPVKIDTDVEIVPIMLLKTPTQFHGTETLITFDGAGLPMNGEVRSVDNVQFWLLKRDSRVTIPAAPTGASAPHNSMPREFPPQTGDVFLNTINVRASNVDLEIRFPKLVRRAAVEIRSGQAGNDARELTFELYRGDVPVGVKTVPVRGLGKFFFYGVESNQDFDRWVIRQRSDTRFFFENLRFEAAEK